MRIIRRTGAPGVAATGAYHRDFGLEQLTDDPGGLRFGTQDGASNSAVSRARGADSSSSRSTRSARTTSAGPTQGE